MASMVKTVSASPYRLLARTLAAALLDRYLQTYRAEPVSSHSFIAENPSVHCRCRVLFLTGCSHDLSWSRKWKCGSPET